MTPLVFLDTETTGVHPSRQAWEIAMIRRDDKGERELSMMLHVDLSEADPFGLKIVGFYERHPKGRRLSGPLIYGGDDGLYEPAEAAFQVAAWTHGAHIVGAVPNFDTETLAPLLRAHGLTPAWHYHLVDVEALAYGYINGRYHYPLPWKSDELSLAIGVAPPTEDERHTAMGDARWAMRIWDRVTGYVH